MPLDWHQGPGDDPDWTTSEMVLMWPPEHHTPYEQDKHWRGLTADPEGLAAHIARHDPARVLAEVEAKRRIVRAHAKWCEGRCEAKYPEGGFDAAHYWSIKSLAAAYADHPDYREEWRP